MFHLGYCHCPCLFLCLTSHRLETWMVQYTEMHANLKALKTQTQMPFHLLLTVKAGSSSSTKSASLDVTFLFELVLMLAVRPQLGLCSRLERECLMTSESSVVAGQAHYGGGWEVRIFRRHILMASIQSKHTITINLAMQCQIDQLFF